jgi:hypothetical protein
LYFKESAAVTPEYLTRFMAMYARAADFMMDNFSASASCCTPLRSPGSCCNSKEMSPFKYRTHPPQKLTLLSQTSAK